MASKRDRVQMGRPIMGAADRTPLPGLRDARTDASISQDKLVSTVLEEVTPSGERAPLFSRSTLQGWEAGRLAPLDVVPYLARALGCTQRRLTEG